MTQPRNRIVFLGNQLKTDFFRQVADRFDQKTTQVCWIVVNASQNQALLQTYPADQVLYLPLSTPATRAPYPVKINDLVFCDRRLRHMMPKGRAYLSAVQGPIVDFLDSDIPTLLVGELTYAYEVLTYRLARQLLPHCHWVSPFLTRVPAGYFAFFADEAFSREVYPPTQAFREAVAQEPEIEEVSYKEMNLKHIARQGSAGFVGQKIKTFLSLKDYDPEDPTWKSNTRSDKLKKNLRWWLNRQSYKRVQKVGLETIEACKGRRVIFPLHLQPELNIDTCGRYWDNQAETILKIWRQLGPEDALFIKEHPVAIGNRGYRWYERLLTYPNLHLLHHAAPVPQLLEAVDYIFTISGTMGLEAALAGRRVLCLAPTTYDRLENVVTPTIADFRRCGTIDALYDTLCAEKAGSWSLADYAAHLDRFSYPGDPEGDRIANPASTSPGNLSRVALAIHHVLEGLETLGDTR